MFRIAQDGLTGVQLLPKVPKPCGNALVENAWDWIHAQPDLLIASLGDSMAKCSFKILRAAATERLMPLIDSREDYQALSYCWDSPFDVPNFELPELFIQTSGPVADAYNSKNKKPIVCNDGRLNISKNPKGRTVQVLRIYQRASSVLVWLGDSLPETGLALDVLQELRRLEEIQRLSITSDSTYKQGVT